VISIIALLMAILLPALGRARLKAKTLKCQSNLRQCGVDLWTAAAEEGDAFAFGSGVTGKEYLWLSRNDWLLCPLANKVLWENKSNPNFAWGTTFSAWAWDPSSEFSNRGSYGMNLWAYVKLNGSQPFLAERAWATKSQAEGRPDYHSVRLPLFSALPEDTDDPRRERPEGSPTLAW
jgi:type II secretory pathway pseudopilin PulG